MKHGFSLMLLWLILPASLFAQFQGNIDAINESVCQANGSVVVSGPASNLYALTGVSIPQIGPFSPPATFTDLPAGDYTITEFTLDNQEHSQAVTVPGNYEQNWIFTAEVDYDPCSNGTPSVSINNFTIINADPGEQRPPYLFRISSKNGSLPGDGSEPPAFTSATSFPIAFPSGMNGNYELQARDACGNYKTINVYVPLTAPSPSLTLAFNSFANCDGDGNYTATPSGGTPPYTFTITAGPDQVGSTITSNNTQSYVFTSGGTYTLQLTDNCGGITQQTVTAPLYQTPVAYGWGAIGSCTPPPGVGTGGINVYIENGIGPYNIVMDSDCGHPTYTGTGNMGNNIIGNLTRPCNYAITITDACGLTSTTNVPLVGPGDGVIYAYTNVRCPEGTSEEYILKIGLGYGPPYNPSPPYTFEVFDASNTLVYTVTQNSDEVLLPLPADTYSIKVTDGCGATGYATQVIPVYSNPTVSIDVSNLCFGAGQANVIGVNNNPIYPSYYSYQIIAGPTRVGEGPEVDSPPNTGQFSALQSGGTYTFAFSDGCKTVTISATIPNYTQPTWEVGFGALCPPGQTADLQIVNLQPEGQVVGPYHWRIISENSDLYNESLPYPSSVGQTSDIFPDLPPKNASGEVATYNILGNDGCKNSYQGSGKVGELPDETLILNTTTVCADGTTYLRARVSTPIVGATYQYFRDGVMVAQSTTLFTVITPALPGAYSVKVIASQLPDESCFVTAGDVVVTAPVDIVSIVPSACISPSNTYNLDVTLSYATSITSLIIKVNGTDYPVTTNGSGNQTFTISNLTANGAANIPVIIDYGLTSCQPTGEYNAPESCECVPFDVIIPDDTVCPGGTTVLDAGAGSAYLWSEGSTTQTITVGIGTYSVTVTNAVGCTGSGSAVVDEYPPFTVTIPDEVVCPGGTTILDAGAGGAYLWSEGSTTQTITVGMGTYSVTVTNVNSCTAVASCNVTEPPVMDATCSKTDVTTNGGADGTASVSASGGTSPYTYLWNTGATTVSISGLVAGTYSVTVTDANGCTDECTTTVQEPGCNLTASASGTNVLCNGGADGTASATASGNTGAVTYLWSNGATTQNVNSLTAGTYSVTITETPTCTAVASYTVTEPSAALDATCSKTDVTTNGGADGTASVSASGGTSPYTYLWNTGATTQSISGLTAGTYSVTVTDANGCTDECTTTVQEPGCSLTASASGTNVLCNGGADGTATASATGNLGAVTYLWSNGATTQNVSTLTAGTYSVTITETPTCTAVASYTVTEPSAALDATCSKTDVTTNGGADGTASVSASGGTSPYTYLWNTGATTASISGLTAGTYSVTVTDANGCTDECTTTVQEPGCNLTASASGTNVLCTGGADGTASATASGNLGAVTYLWSNGATTQNVNSLAAGTYSVTITETPTCTAVASYTVTEPSAALDATCSKTDVTTNGGADGTASVSASGGTSPYTYLWNTGATTQSISGLTAGTYSVTVTDANGCTDECTTTVQEPGCNLTASASGTNVLCNGGADGTASATASGNTGAVTYLWSNGATTASISSLAVGTYSVTITETPTCTAVASYTVTEPSAALDATCSKTDVTTNGGADGTASVSASGGTSPYTYLWNTGATTSSISGLVAGTYSVTVTDANGCTDECTTTVQEPGCSLTASASGTNVLCNGGADGTATATASGNTGAVTYLWSNGATTASISSLAVGTYSVTITETPTCTAVASYTVTEPSAALDATCSKTDVTTNGGADGTASVSASGGTSPYTYLWNTGATTSSISGLVAGTYSVTVTDANGCTDECTTTVQEPGCNLTASASGTNVLCNGGADGTASASATGNLGAVTYLWSNGATTQNVNSLTAGTYSVTITETPTCTAVASYTVTEPSAALDATCSKTDVTTNGGADGTASVSASGGTSPYTYLWNTGATTQGLSGLTAGTYSVTVTDANGCTDECTTTLQEPGCNLTASASGTNVLCNGGADGTASATASGNTGAVTYLWSNGATTQNVNSLTAGTYSVTITETPTCTAVASYTVTEPSAALDATCSKTDVTTNGGADGTASVSASGGTSPYTYLWNTGATTQSISGLVAGTYSVTVTDANGCTDECTTTVQEPAPCAISVVSALPSNCDPATSAYSLTVTVTYSGQPAGNILVSTSTGESLSVAQTSSPQVIMLTGLAANGMTGIDVTATFVGDNACTHTLADAYDAPVDCAACPPAQCIPVTITKSNP